MMRPRQAALVAAAGLLCLLAGPLVAGEAAPAPGAVTRPAPTTAKTPEKKPAEPVHVWADRIRYLHQQHRATIKGTATIIKADLRIDCDEVEALLEPTTNRFKKIVATGNVRIHTVKPIAERTNPRPPLQPVPGGRSASCDRAEYDPINEVIILTGSQRTQPVVQIGTDRLRGNLITYDRKKDLVVVEGNSKITARIPESASRPLAPPKPPAK